MQTARRYIPAALILVGVIVAWEVLVRASGVQGFILPAPSAIWAALAANWTEGYAILAAAQVTWQASDAVAVSAGGRFEHEEGFADAGSRSSTDRDNYGSFVELRAERRRLFANAGVGYDHNAIFGPAWTPRLSAAVYLREPRAQGSVGDTKLVFNLGRGIKGIFSR